MLIYLSDTLIVNSSEIIKAKWADGRLTLWLKDEDLPYLYEDTNRRTWLNIVQSCQRFLPC